MYEVFSYDATAAILVLQNNDTTAMLVYRTNLVRVVHFSFMQTLSFVPINLHGCWPRVGNAVYRAEEKKTL